MKTHITTCIDRNVCTPITVIRKNRLEEKKAKRLSDKNLMIYRANNKQWKPPLKKESFNLEKILHNFIRSRQIKARIQKSISK